MSRNNDHRILLFIKTFLLLYTKKAFAALQPTTGLKDSRNHTTAGRKLLLELQSSRSAAQLQAEWVHLQEWWQSAFQAAPECRAESDSAPAFDTSLMAVHQSLDTMIAISVPPQRMGSLVVEKQAAVGLCYHPFYQPVVSWTIAN